MWIVFGRVGDCALLKLFLEAGIRRNRGGEEY